MSEYTGPGVIPADHEAAMAAARDRIRRTGTAAVVFDANMAALSRRSRQLAMPVPITCGDCGKVCLDSNGAGRTTTDRAMRVDFCDACKREHAANTDTP